MDYYAYAGIDTTPGVQIPNNAFIGQATLGGYPKLSDGTHVWYRGAM